jgi:type II secretory pathway component GspD/PulD (secretin)
VNATEKVITTCCMITALCSFTLVAQTPQDPEGRKKSPIVTEDVNPRLKALVTMRAQDANLSEVLKILADRSGMNFVTGEGVYKEKITIILNKTPVDQAIDLVVRAAGLSYEIIGNSVLIAETDKLKGEVGLQGYVVELKYVNAEEVAAMLGDLTKNVKVDKGGNKLVCFTSPRVINEIERMVKSIDHPHILVMLETRLIEVTVDKLKQYGIKWNDLTPIETGLLHPVTPLTAGYGLNKFNLKNLTFSMALDMLVENGDANVLMNSKLTTTNNHEATLHIGEVIPYVIQTYNQAGMSGGASMQVQKENVGVLMSMTPHVNENEQVTLTLSPEVSNIESWKGANADLPLVRVRKTTTTVRVENGQTVFLAGLLSEEKNTVIDKVPVLGDIPLLGLLFQHKREQVKKSNLIIEIKPTIIHDSAEAVSSKADSSNQTASESAELAPVQEPIVIVQPAGAAKPQAGTTKTDPKKDAR